MRSGFSWLFCSLGGDELTMENTPHSRRNYQFGTTFILTGIRTSSSDSRHVGL
jgi:hypothetical protein